jgi:hypothetical protein
MSASDATAEPTSSSTPSINVSPPSLPEDKTTPQLLNTLRAHQIMLTNLYIPLNNAYVSAYTAYTLRCAAVEISYTENKEIIAKLLEQQREILLFQGLLWSFHALVVELESTKIAEGDEIDDGYAGRQELCVGIGGGKLATGINGMWR